jgi:hypothetical protein
MNLAKHEVPKLHGVPAAAPGHGRIDGRNGSISWQIDLGNDCVDLVSRRSLADELKTLVIDKRGARATKGRGKPKRQFLSKLVPPHWIVKSARP